MEVQKFWEFRKVDALVILFTGWWQNDEKSIGQALRAEH